MWYLDCFLFIVNVLVGLILAGNCIAYFVCGIEIPLLIWVAPITVGVINGFLHYLISSRTGDK